MRAEVAIHGGERLQKSLLPQGGHRFDPQQQFLPFLGQNIEALLQIGEAGLQLFELFEGQHVHRLEGLHPRLQAVQLGLQCV
jgi:hypothetical protein